MGNRQSKEIRIGTRGDGTRDSKEKSYVFFLHESRLRESWFIFFSAEQDKGGRGSSSAGARGTAD